MSSDSELDSSEALKVDDQQFTPTRQPDAPRNRATNRRSSIADIPRCNNNRRIPRTFNHLLPAGMDGPCQNPEVTRWS